VSNEAPSILEIVVETGPNIIDSDDPATVRRLQHSELGGSLVTEFFVGKQSPELSPRSVLAVPAEPVFRG
jgi:hypothetical protein